MAWNIVRRLADAIHNDVLSGLRNYHLNISISTEQLELDVVDTRLLVIKEYLIKGILPTNDLLMSLNCIPVDCDTLDKCNCSGIICGEPTAHFQIPQVLFDFGLDKSIRYIGSSDRLHSFLVYTKPIELIKTFSKYRKRGKNKPWVYVDITPNQLGFLDCYIFNAPLIKLVSVTGIFKDLRQLEDFQCNCFTNNEATQMDTNYNFIDTIVKERLTKEKLYYYRLLASPITPNNQQITAG